VTAHPHRLRRDLDRHTHAARAAVALPDVLVTACGYTEGPQDHRLEASAPITCPRTACLTATEETSR
jgi:hypothetical protein